MSDRRYPRTARVNEVVHEVLADELELLSDPRLELVTITGVDVAPDLKTARVFYSVLDPALGTADESREAIPGEVDADDEDDGFETDATEERREETAKALQSARRHLQAALGRQVRLKYVPKLVFTEDPAILAGRRIDDIIRQLHEGES